MDGGDGGGRVMDGGDARKEADATSAMRSKRLRRSGAPQEAGQGAWTERGHV